MASVKNSSRRTRKYAGRTAATASNKARKQRRHERRAERMRERTLALVGRKASCMEAVTSGEGVRLVRFHGIVHEVHLNGSEHHPGKAAVRSNGSYVTLKRGNDYKRVSRHRLRIES